MRRTIFLFLVGLFVSIVSFGQRVEIPMWIRGTWHNSAESNTENFETFVFATNKIYFIKGLSFIKSKKDNITKVDLTKNRLDLFDKYKNYKTKPLFRDSLFQINFYNSKESVTYEFKLHDIDYFKQPVLTYSITINGKTIREHLTSFQNLLTRSW